LTLKLHLDNFREIILPEIFFSEEFKGLSENIVKYRRITK